MITSFAKNSRYVIILCRRQETNMRLLFTLLWTLPVLYGQNDWPVYGHDAGNEKYSALKQVNTGNVSKLSRAWTFDLSAGNGARTVSQTTPLVINGVMYLITSHQSLVAL